MKKSVNFIVLFLSTLLGSSLAQAHCNEGQATAVVDPVQFCSDQGCRMLQRGTQVRLTNIKYTHGGGIDGYVSNATVVFPPATIAQKVYGESGQIVDCQLVRTTGEVGTVMIGLMNVGAFACDGH